MRYRVFDSPGRVCWAAGFSATILAVGMLSNAAVMAQETGEDSSVGQSLEAFELQDFRGKVHQVNPEAADKGTIIAVLGVDCPLAKLYAPTLNEIAKSSRDKGFAFYGLDPNSQDSITDMAAFARIYNVEFPLLKDVGNVVSDQLGATRTPEVFLLDAEGKIQYQGRIDNRYGVGSVRETAVEHYLEDAITAVVADSAIENNYVSAVGCLIGRVREAKLGATVTYANQVSRILQKHCVECHRQGEIAPFELVDYEEVSGWADMIAEVVDEQRMPPWHASPDHGEFRNDRSMTAEEKEILLQWARDGAPFGDEADLPETPRFVSGWQLPSEPDFVFPVTEEPYNVPAEGAVEYEYFEVDPGFKEDKWVKAAELLPGNHAVVHHILVFARQPGQSLEATGGGTRGFLVGYVPGMRVEPYADGMAKRIPAGSKLLFQIHYTPIGTPQKDLSKLGLVLVDKEEVEFEVMTTSAVQTSIRIPAEEDAHDERAFSHLPLKNYQLLSMMPHMHLRGSGFRYELVKPDLSRETLLDVPNYDFNWQTDYRLAEPIRLSEGERIKCTAVYDNSEMNPYNPNPKRNVGWGDQTWDEMMIGYFDLAIPIDEAEALHRETRELAKDRLGMRVREYLATNDDNGDGQLSVEELPARVQPAMGRLDGDGDGVLTSEELKRAFGGRR